LARRLRQGHLEDFALPTVDQAQELQQQRALALKDQTPEPAGSERVEPEQLLDHLLRTQSYVTEADLGRGAERLTGATGPEAIQAVIARALRRDDLLLLRDEQSQVGYTIAAVREEEQQALAAARGLAGRRQRVFDPDMVQGVGKARGLSTEQQAALQHALGPERLAVITGRAGTGKTHTLAVINEIASTAGWHVVGLAPTNTLAQDLSESGIAETRTVHSLIWHLENAPNHPVARFDSIAGRRCDSRRSRVRQSGSPQLKCSPIIRSAKDSANRSGQRNKNSRKPRRPQRGRRIRSHRFRPQRWLT
jgi:hypothetical protein